MDEARPRNSAKARGQRRIKQATGAMLGASLLLTGGVAILINAGLDQTATASSSSQTATSTPSSTSNSTSSDSRSVEPLPSDIQVQPGNGDSQAVSTGS